MTSQTRRVIRYVSIPVSLVVVALLLSPGSSPSATVERFGGETMGTTYEIAYVAEVVDPELPRAVNDLLAGINHSLSTYSPVSVISALNASTDSLNWHPVDDHLAAVFRRSQEVFNDTSGAFNPAVGPLVDAWGFGAIEATGTPDETSVGTLLALTRFEAFDLRLSPPSVRKPAAEARLDFNAIAEGYAIDGIARILEGRSIRDYLIELGGEVRASGQRPEGGAWRVGIERPMHDALAEGRIQSVFELNNAALATSGSYRNYRVLEGRKMSHILDPQTGHPADRGLLSVSVLARDATTADAYATALMVMGADKGIAFVESREFLEALFISTNERGIPIVHRSAGFPEALP